MLSQQQADDLISIEKVMALDTFAFPIPGETLTMPAQTVDHREEFQLDIERGRKNPSKWKMQLRYHNIDILARLDIGGPGHVNPRKAPTRELSRYEGQRMPTPHLQRYVEGFEDTWAIPVPPEFTELGDPMVTWTQFLNYCNVTTPPVGQGSF